MSATSKTRFPRALALDVARELVAALKPVCDRLVIAGSLRRRKTEVGDVEVLYIPRFETVRDGLFDTAQLNLADRSLEILEARGILGEFPSFGCENGAYCGI